MNLEGGRHLKIQLFECIHSSYILLVYLCSNVVRKTISEQNFINTKLDCISVTVVSVRISISYINRERLTRRVPTRICRLYERVNISIILSLAQTTYIYYRLTVFSHCTTNRNTG